MKLEINSDLLCDSGHTNPLQDIELHNRLNQEKISYRHYIIQWDLGATALLLNSFSQLTNHFP